MLVLGMLAVLAGSAVPTYMEYRIRSDLYNAAEQVGQSLSRARILAQSGKGGTAWGVHVSHGILFAGNSYAERDAKRDERYVLPLNVQISGLTEVAFSSMEGVPSATGTIVLTSVRQERATVEVLIERQGITVNIDDRLTICHRVSGSYMTLRLPESAWPVHRKHGDTLGACP